MGGAEFTKRSVFLQGHDGEFTFMVKSWLLMETSEAPRIFSWSFDKTFKRWKLTHQTSPTMMLSAPFAEMDGTKLGGSWSGFADDLFIKDVLPDHTAESAKDVILNNAPSLDTTLAEDRYKQNVSKLQLVQGIRRHGEKRRLTSLVPFGKILGGARHLGGRYAFNGCNKAEIECRSHAMAAKWSAFRGFWFARSPLSHRRQIFLCRKVSASITGLDAYVASPGGMNRIDKKFPGICAHFLAPRWRVRDAVPRVEGATSTSGDRNQKSEVLAGNDGAQPRTPADNGGDTETAPRRASNIDGRRRLSAPTANLFAVAFSKDMHLFAGLSGTEDFL